MMKHNPARGLALALACGLSHGQSGESLLLARDGGPLDTFGFGLAVDGDTIVVGSKADDDGGVDSGAVYVFERSRGAWTQTAKLVASDAFYHEMLGFALSIEGDTLAAGAPYDSDNGSFSGSVYVFARDRAGWVEQQKLKPLDGSTADRFGLSLAVSGGSLVAGAPFSQDAGHNSGSIYVFQRVGPTWTEWQKLIPPDLAPGDEFGYAVAKHGERLVAGSHRQDDRGSAAGKAYVYESDGLQWNLAQELFHPGAHALDHFGRAVAIGSHTLVVGAPGDDGEGSAAGAALVFERDDVKFAPTQRLVASRPEAGAQFGLSLALSGGRLVVGAPYEDARGPDAGAAYVFERIGTGWVQTARLVPGTAAEHDYGGWAVAVSGDAVLTGAWGDDDLGQRCGSVTAFDASLPFVAFCAGDGSGRPCPCANESLPGLAEGCRNSTGGGGRLVAGGSAGIVADDMRPTALGLPAGSFGILFAGRDAVAGGDGLPLGAGLRCAGGTALRLGFRLENGSGAMGWGPGLGAEGDWGPGDVRRFQVLYRDVLPGAPCRSGVNLTNGIEVVFRP